MTIVANTRIFNTVNQVFDTFKTAANGALYVFASKNLPWSNDLVPDSMDGSVLLNQYQMFDEMVFGKIVTSTDYVQMIDNNTWTSGTVYTQYDDHDPILFSKKFFVITHENGYYNVFKCLDNNSGAASIYQPKLVETSADDEYYTTSDGYQWKYMYGIEESLYNKFATIDYAPLYPNSDVALYASNGGIETVRVIDGGSNYIAYTNGYFTAVTVSSNPLLHSLQSTDVLTITVPTMTGTFFQSGETISQANNVANVSVSVGGTQTTTYMTSTAKIISANSTILVVTDINGPFNTTTKIVGGTSTANAIPTIIATNSISPNTDFYTDSSLYIDGGTGFGQARRITRYIVTGTQHRVLVESAFNPQPDLTSHYVISPRVVITGDGSGAEAVSIVNTISQSISSVKIINRGKNYSYANVTVVGNTGSTSQYLNIGISNTVGTFSVGETVLETATGATGQVVTVNSTIMQLTNINGVLSGSTTSSGNSNFTSNSIIIGQSSATSAKITVVATSSANVQSIISPFGGHGSNPAFELNANKIGVSVSFSNNEYGTIPIENEYRRIGILANPLFANVQLNISAATGTFQVGETVVQTVSTNSVSSVYLSRLKTYTYNLSNYTALNLSTSHSFQNGDLVYQTSPSVANGVIVSNAGFQYVVVRADVGNFANGSTILGNPSGNLTFSSNVGAFVTGETVRQSSSNATGVVTFSNTTTLALKEMNGTFVVSSNVIGSSSAATASITGVGTLTTLSYTITKVANGYSNIISGLDSSNNTFGLVPNSFYSADVHLNNYPIPNIGTLPLSTVTYAASFSGTTASANIVANTGLFSNSLVGYNIYFNSNGALIGEVASVPDANTVTLTNYSPYTFTTNSINASIKNTTQPAYSINASAITFYNHTLLASDIVVVNTYAQTSTISTNSSVKATGIVTASNSSYLTLSYVNNFFVTGSTITGANSFVTANVTSIYGQPSATFDQRTRLACTYESGSLLFNQNEYVQQGFVGLDGAYGYIQAIDPIPINAGIGTISSNSSTKIITGVGTNFNSVLSAGYVLYAASNNAYLGTVAIVTNSTSVTLSSNSLYALSTGSAYEYASSLGNFTVALTGSKGIFQSSDLTAGLSKYIQSADQSKKMKVNGIIKPQLVPYTGNIIYAENIIPVARAINQSETIKIVLQFY